jgi:hypothetical protein
MATTYIGTLPDTKKETKVDSYERLRTLILHLEPLGLDLLDYSMDQVTGAVKVTLSDPLPADQLDHLSLINLDKTAAVK